MKHQRTIPALLLGALLFSVSCGDDGLKKGWVPPGPGDEDYGSGLPIRPGDTFWYGFSHSYRRSTGSCEGGMTCGEKQSSGNMCLKVTTVADTETADFANAPETVVNARVKVVGDSGGGDIIIDDQDASTADANVVDTALAGLWLKQLSVPSRDHGFLNPTEEAFSTREAPVPPGQELANLPFFDVRTSSKWDWGGWDLINDDCETLYTNEADCPDTCRWEGACVNKATNFLNGILGYYISEFGATYFGTPSQFYKRHPFNPVCEDYANLTDCQMAQCTWDFMANGGNGACIVLYTLDVRWRHNLTTGGPELQGQVLHSLRFEYNENGSLRAGKELIAPDPNPSGGTSSDLVNFTGCFADQPCATASFELDDRTWAEAHCTF